MTAAYEFRMIPEYARNIRRLQGGIEKMNQTVSVIRCADYEISNVQQAVCQLLAPLGGLSWVRPGRHAHRAESQSGRRIPAAGGGNHPSGAFMRP